MAENLSEEEGMEVDQIDEEEDIERKSRRKVFVLG